MRTEIRVAAALAAGLVCGSGAAANAASLSATDFTFTLSRVDSSGNRTTLSDDELKNIGIVMLTAIGEKVNELTSPLYGADAYVDKPFDFNDLEKKIKTILDEKASLS